jgi:3-oxoacyl-[acyl-carrier protein] reductase
MYDLSQQDSPCGTGKKAPYYFLPGPAGVYIEKIEKMAKTYVVVGATSGIGQQVAEDLIGQGATVYALSRRGELPDGPASLIHARCDVLAEQPTFPQLDEPLDGLAYLPGTINLKPFHLLRRKDFVQDLEVNYLGAVKTLQQYLPRLRAAESASIVLMSTVAAQTGLAFHASVAGAKGAVEGLTRALAAELAPKIRVNAVAPSLTDTPSPHLCLISRPNGRPPPNTTPCNVSAQPPTSHPPCASSSRSNRTGSPGKCLQWMGACRALDP